MTNQVSQALDRIAPYIHKTPLVSSERLNTILGHNLIFKAESLQKTGAFKVRGVLNHLLSLKEQNNLPPKIVAYSTGNHAIASAYVAKLLGIEARVYLPINTSKVKQQQAGSFGAEVIFTSSRQEAEDRSREDGMSGFYYLHPSDSDATILGTATLCLEAISQSTKKIDAIFASCGGGGLLSGCYLAKEETDRDIKIIGVEPEIADDAARSRNNGKIYRFATSPNTIADGLRTLSLSERTFNFIKKLDDFILVGEDEIKFWTVWLMHLLKIICEPSCGVSMAGAYQWLKKQTKKQNIMIMISGGNIDPDVLCDLLSSEYLLRKIEGPLSGACE
ncbi:MAG: serine/threonine dehydratase [Rickettsiaceae bacterium]|nr:serine/threonine dehydratase [Rickettsiaceae bacterium]